MRTADSPPGEEEQVVRKFSAHVRVMFQLEANLAGSVSKRVRVSQARKVFTLLPDIWRGFIWWAFVSVVRRMRRGSRREVDLSELRRDCMVSRVCSR